MSGLISSLLIEPVIRRTRHLSSQTDTSTSGHSGSDSPPSSQCRTEPYPLSDDNGSREITMSDRNQEYMGLGCGYAGPGNDPANLPTTSTLDSGATRDGRRADTAPSSDLGNGSDNFQSIGDDLVSPGSGPAPSERSAEAFITLTQTSNNHERRRSQSRESDMDESGWQFALPEDDGMGVLRRKIHTIRDMKSSSAEKARMVHELMTEKYNASRGYPDNLHPPLLVSSSSQTPERSSAPIFHREEPSFDHPLSPTVALDQPNDNPYNLTEEDLKPTFFPKDEPESPVLDAEDMDIEEFEETAMLGCQHYKRNVKLQCVACKKWYTCRFCHDDVEDHHLIRHKTENMLCMICGHAQPAAHICEKCGEQAAQYFCEVCKLWDNNSKKSIYHCADCGICRIGQGLGKDFFHCKTCSVCLPISIENTHRCIERSTQCDCPICGDYMFTSPETVVVMRCGHSIHHRCLSDYSKSSYRCPICSKTITNMESTFRNLDRTIYSQPMPEEFKDTRALVYCNDCGAKSVVEYHWLGLKCDMCESYNTAQLRLLHGNLLESPEQDLESRHVSASRARSSSHGAEEALSQTMAPLRINTNSVQGTSFPQQSLPSSADPSGRFLSYSLTRDRAVSPVISNYFGLPPNRENDDKSISTSLFGSRTQTDTGNDHGGELRIWGTKLKYSYGFLSRETESVDGEEAVESSDASVSEDDEDDEEREEEDDDDDDDSIDIFGHR
ncbi:RING finger and CHY zinc finger domain-containing protein [Aspergillus chevalieri]|uniref:CHY and RING finger domain protein n=1 Tax=Aspergillus chevalieri TaxID=182096 RepID=A0A7R7ZMV8_ASPCH|nr:uncharacterized protein ACHE_30991A [Aspergillus chevalieri]BCR87004.1 hypothetical protein ACHE_30991A [Aspergillus chevalieri]